MKKKDYTALMSKFKKTGYDATTETHVYKCAGCGKIEHSICIDRGVTPMYVKCPKCGAWLGHVATEPGVSPAASMIWHRPSFEEFSKLTTGEQTHVINGGLILKNNS